MYGYIFCEHRVWKKNKNKYFYLVLTKPLSVYRYLCVIFIYKINTLCTSMTAFTYDFLFLNACHTSSYCFVSYIGPRQTMAHIFPVEWRSLKTRLFLIEMNIVAQVCFVKIYKISKYLWNHKIHHKLSSKHYRVLSGVHGMIVIITAKLRRFVSSV